MNWLGLAWLASVWGPAVTAGALLRSIGASGGGGSQGGGGSSGSGPSIQVAQSTGDFSSAVVGLSLVAAAGCGQQSGARAGGSSQGGAAAGDRQNTAGRMASPGQRMPQGTGEVYTFRFEGGRPVRRSRKTGRRGNARVHRE